MLKNIFAVFFRRYVEEIELTLPFFAAENRWEPCAVTSERWRHYPKSIAPHDICTHWNKWY